MDIVSTMYNIVHSEIKRRVPDWGWMTVTGVNPLRIKYDHETDPLDLTPDTMVPGLRVGDRVYVKIRSGEMPLILGRSINTTPVLPVPGENMLLDQTFSNPDVWEKSLGSSLVWSSSGGKNGGGTATITQTSTPANITLYSTASPYGNKLWRNPRVIPGHVYEMSVWVKSSTASSAIAAGIVYGFLSDNGTVITTPTIATGAIATPTAGTWYQVVSTVTAPEGATSLIFGPSMRSTYLSGSLTFSDPVVMLKPAVWTPFYATPATTSDITSSSATPISIISFNIDLVNGADYESLCAFTTWGSVSTDIVACELWINSFKLSSASMYSNSSQSIAGTSIRHSTSGIWSWGGGTGNFVGSMSFFRAVGSGIITTGLTDAVHRPFVKITRIK